MHQLLLYNFRSGFEILLGEKAYWEMIYELRDLEARSFEDTIHKTEPWQSLEETWLSIKAAIWGLSSVASSNIGAEELEKEGVISLLINLAESCPLLSIKGTAFYALGNHISLNNKRVNNIKFTKIMRLYETAVHFAYLF